MLKNLVIVIVSWNTCDLLDRCITTITESLLNSPIEAAVIVVDNASRDGTPAMLREHHPQVELIELGGNLGFAGGNNLALRRLALRAWRLREGKVPQAEAVLLLNPDTEIIGDALSVMMEYLTKYPDVNVIGPRLRYADDSVQSSRRRFPTPAMFFFESTPISNRWPNNPWARRYAMQGPDDPPDSMIQDVGWLVGAALLVRRSAIEQAGILDAGFHMYSEESEWQERIAALAGRIVYLPEAEIRHYEGKSSEQAVTARSINFHISRLRYAGMRHGPELERLAHAVLCVGLIFEAGIELTKWLLGHRRDLRTQRLEVYRALLERLFQGSRSTNTPQPRKRRV